MYIHGQIFKGPRMRNDGIFQKVCVLRYFRYHTDERLLPEYDSSMSDNVTAVIQDSSTGTEENSKKHLFDDYYYDDLSGAFPGRSKSSMYLATLRLHKVRPEQRGTYKCGPSNAKSASVELHITDGKVA
jgi:hypothetical protein